MKIASASILTSCDCGAIAMIFGIQTCIVEDHDLSSGPTGSSEKQSPHIQQARVRFYDQYARWKKCIWFCRNLLKLHKSPCGAEGELRLRLCDRVLAISSAARPGSR